MKLNNLKLFLAMTLIVITTTLKAQDLLIGISGGGATFGMKSTKEFNQTIVSLLPFTPVLTDNFPPYFYIKGEFLYCFHKNLALGLNVSSTSTGARLSLADYSGKYTLDNIQKGYFPGVKLLLGEAPGTSNGINFSLEGGVAFSNMIIKEDMEISGESASDEYELSAMGFFVQPGLNYFLCINSKLRFSADLSYYFGIEKGYHLTGSKDQKLLNSKTRKPIKPQWDGIRLGITAYWCLWNNTK